MWRQFSQGGGNPNGSPLHPLPGLFFAAKGHLSLSQTPSASSLIRGSLDDDQFR